MDQSRQSSQARFSIGIDLGTTHCALSYVDRQASDGEKVEQGVLDIPQLTGPSSVEARPLLPSFLYRSEEHTSELQSPCNLVCRLLLEKKKNRYIQAYSMVT